MNGYVVKGWCPDAWRPMEAGDGLLVRVKPRLARLSRDQALGLCALAGRFGNGMIDVSRRANLQIRGVGAEDWAALLDELLALDLVDADPRIEKQRNLLISPDWTEGDDTHRIASELIALLDQLPDMPGKVGFVIDAGPAPALLEELGDFRIERGAAGGLVLRATGRATGVEAPHGEEAALLVALARWFCASGGLSSGRMAHHDAPLPAWATGAARPGSPARAMAPGLVPLGTAHGIAFGQVDADVLAGALADPTATGLRVTPWRILVVEGVRQRKVPGLIADAADPLLHAFACPGTPACPQGSVATRELARQLAGAVCGTLHVSGCAKGCAFPQAADLVLTGREGRFDLARNARAGSLPEITELSPAAVLAHFGVA